MSKKIHIKILSKSNLIVICSKIVISLVIVATALSYYRKSSSIDSRYKSTAQNVNLDSVNDGLYSNYEYGFSFMYPQETFITQYGPKTMLGKAGSEHNVQWYTLESDSESAFKKEPWLLLRVNHVTISKNDLVNDFNRIYALTINEDSVTQIHAYEARKIRVVSIKGGKGVVYSREFTRKDTIPEPPYGYHAVWLKGDDVIWLDLVMQEEDTNLTYEKIFDDMVESFVFIQ